MITYLNRVAVIETPDGKVSITKFSENDMQRYGFTDEDAFMTWYMNRVFPGMAFTVIPETDVPTDRSQRNHWSLKGLKVQVDPTKVAAHQQKEAQKTALLNKLKISPEEAKLLKEI